MISLDQYRAKIGAFNSTKVKGKDSTDVTLAPSDPSFDFSPPLGDQSYTTWANICLKIPLKSSIVTLISLALLRILLVIGNIESNPGPTHDLVMADLIISSDDDNIKKVLTQFKVPNSLNANYQALKKVKIEPLKATLKFLMNWNEEASTNSLQCYTKEGIMHLILRRLKNLLPDTCGSCGKESHFSTTDYDDSSVLCLRSERKMCDNCDPDEVRQVKSYNSSTFFVCKTCVDHIKEDEKLGKECFRKGMSPSSSDSPNSDPPGDTSPTSPTSISETTEGDRESSDVTIQAVSYTHLTLPTICSV